jgi:hypothetical protein
MAQNLFPVFDVPSALAEDAPVRQIYRPSPLFDFVNGEFVTNGARQPIYGSGHDAWVLWCIKTILTQRWAHYGYSSNSGIEAEEAFVQPDRQAVQSYFERTITEALLADPMGRTRIARNFQFRWVADSLHITCEVYGADGNTAAITATLRP